MPRLIFKCPHIKSGADTAAHLENYVGYIATREGVEKISASQASKPATPKQVTMVKQLIREFPLSKGLFEYEDYLAAPTRGNASEFISRAIEDNLDQVAKRENYLQYIAQRPHAERLGSHGLFTDKDDELVLSQVSSAVAGHPGTVWLPILSLRREDARRLGYDNAQRWRQLITESAPKLAEAMRIPLSQFRWYAAFHDESHHPHVHMVVYSADGWSGFLTRKGIEKFKSELVNEIFRQELTEIYQRQTMRRDELTTQSRERMESLLREMEAGTLENQRMGQLMVNLAQQLQTIGGRKQYGYLKAPLKALVDEIVDELAKDTRVSQAYDLWYEQREEVLRSYKDDLPDRVPLSQQKELRQIKNMIIQEAVRMNAPLPPEPAQEPDLTEEPSALPDTPPPEDIPVEDEEPLPNTDWTEEYMQARMYLYGTEETSPDFGAAYELFHQEAQRGNALAMCNLGRMWIDGLGRDANPEEGQRWYAKALTTFLELEELNPKRYTEYRIGKLYAEGLGTAQDYTTAAEWFALAAEQGHKYAQYSLAGLYLRGQGVSKDTECAHQLYTASAVQGFPYAAFELGKLYRDGSGCEQSLQEAERWFRSAYQGFKNLEAQSHDDKLQYRLGWMHLHGVGIEQNKQLAQEWFNRSAQLGNPNAQYQLAKLVLVDSSPTTEQIKAAVEYLSKAADAGQDCAQYALGKLYRDGIGVEKDMLKAVVWFALAAEQDNSYAAYALGKLYLVDEEVPKDMEKALRWLRRSAEQENQFAQYQLGRLFLAGEDVPKDVDEAVWFLTASAKQGNQYAQYQLGKLYLLGHEVEKDEKAAVRWFTLSATQGNEYAQWFLDHLHEFGDPTPTQCVIRLLHHMSKVFQGQSQRQAGLRIEVDKKLRQKIREKKIVMGHKADDHEDYAIGQSQKQ